MPTQTLVFPHALSPEEAADRIRGFVAGLRAGHPEYAASISESWEGTCARFEGTVMGFSVTGQIEAGDREVRLSLSYPFVALPFRGRIEAMIQETAEKLLH